MASGKTFDIRHPEMIRVARSFLVVFSSATEAPDSVEKWETVSVMLIEFISHLDVPVSP
jgi:hypothetical protein